LVRRFGRVREVTDSKVAVMLSYRSAMIKIMQRAA